MDLSNYKEDIYIGSLANNICLPHIIYLKQKHKLCGGRIELNISATTSKFNSM